MAAERVSRRAAIQAGADYLSLTILALMATAVPRPEPALPDWLADDPKMATAFERFARASTILEWDQPDLMVTFIDDWAAFLEKKAEQLNGATS